MHIIIGSLGVTFKPRFHSSGFFYAFMPRDAGNTDRKIDQNRLLINLIKRAMKSFKSSDNAPEIPCVTQ